MLLAVVNIVGLFYLWKFADKYVYGSMFLDKQEIISMTSGKISDLDENKFNALLSSYAERERDRNLLHLDNPFADQ